MHRIGTLLATLALLGPAPALTRADGGEVSIPGDPAPEAPAAGETIAKQRYVEALARRDRALELERTAPDATSERTREWEAAIALYRSAIEKQPNFHQAHSDLGYAYRKLGRYPESLAAYDRALEIEPDYPQALEYAGEAYLALNRIEDGGGCTPQYSKSWPVH